jgi:hypothetical protein
MRKKAVYFYWNNIQNQLGVAHSPTSVLTIRSSKQGPLRFASEARRTQFTRPIRDRAEQKLSRQLPRPQPNPFESASKSHYSTAAVSRSDRCHVLNQPQRRLIQHVAAVLRPRLLESDHAANYSKRILALPIFLITSIMWNKNLNV